MTDENLTIFANEPSKPTKPQRTKKRLRDRWLLLSIIAVLLTGLIAASVVIAWYGKSVVDALDSIKRDPALIPDTQQPRPPAITPAPGKPNAPMNILLMGTDARTTTERGRSDVLMLLHLPGDRKSAYLISIPRDYWVDIPGKRTAKINAAYSWGGPALTVRTVEQLINVPINHTVLINFDGFSRVIDAVGGVTVYNRYASQIDGTSFPQGEVTLDGTTGLKFVRNRYGLPNHDFDRSQRQRAVVMAVFDKLFSRGILTNPIRFRDAVTALGPNFTVDPGFTNDKIVELGMQSKLTGSKDIHSKLAPVAGSGISSDKQMYIKVDRTKLTQLAAAIRNDALAEYYKNQ